MYILKIVLINVTHLHRFYSKSLNYTKYANKQLSLLHTACSLL